ncbi:hypothetical protein [Streptomyces nondiastaticus]|uniref:Tetratricopeptide repeat protein n=1 Tax=Streptomyces nondiastaticus TaxID=3154512 RepID=A0ABW6U106_9ACTN
MLDRLRTASRHSGSPAGESEALCHLGSIYLGIADCRAAQECYGQALDACHRAGEADTLRRVTGLLLRRHATEAARPFLDRLIELSRQEPPPVCP